MSKMTFKDSVKTYYKLTKPGIIRGNAVAAIAGFFLASQHHPNLLLFLAMLSGLSLIIGAACVFNNYIDRGIDKKMKRTQGRALVNGSITGRSALLFGTIIGLLGTTILSVYTNLLTTAIALFGVVAYVVLYGIGKRTTTLSTLIGSISGAIPPVVGYCAVSNKIDTAAILLFFILVCWQMPHFFAIGIKRRDEYAEAGLPILPVKKGFTQTYIQILFYTVAYVVVSVLLALLGYAGVGYLIVISIVGLAWIAVGLQGFRATDRRKWASQMFLFSLLVLLVQSATISIDALF